MHCSKASKTQCSYARTVVKLVKRNARMHALISALNARMHLALFSNIAQCKHSRIQCTRCQESCARGSVLQKFTTENYGVLNNIKGLEELPVVECALHIRR